MRRIVVAGLAIVLGSWVGGYAVVADQAAGQGPAPTFAADVAPILYENCVGCHRPGQIGPMSLLTYDDARPYATSIKEEVAAGHMPPWHANAAPGTFQNDRRLSEADKRTIIRWVDGGARRGDDAEMPRRPVFAEGWTIGEPDAVFSLPEAYGVPAEGTIEYQYFEVATNFTEDKWIQAIEILPEARAVVHHALVYAREPEDVGPERPRVLQSLEEREERSSRRRRQNRERRERREGEEEDEPRRLGNLIATTAPGTNAMIYRPGTALQVRAGAVLTFQMHYTSNGIPTTDRTSVGFVFADEPPANEMRAGAFLNGEFEIPAGASDYQVDAKIGFSEDVEVWGLFPHTHLRGIKWSYRLVYPDGRSELILDVPEYDFNWQTYYMFEEPLAVPAGSRIEASAWYDNSAANPSNPDPKSPVRWGDQTWEEMQYTGIHYTVNSQRTPAGGRR